jgi:hypothetical protein
LGGGDEATQLESGGFCLVPASVAPATVAWSGPVEFLEVRPG